LLRLGKLAASDEELKRQPPRCERGGRIHMSDWLDRDALLALGLDAGDVARLLRDTQHSGHDGQPVVSAEELDDLLWRLDHESDERK
jgi:hypothetical protein